jgi:hypothetical protein
MAKDIDVKTGELIFKNFKGINNIASPGNLALDELTEATNVNIDNEGRIQRRDGYTRKYEALVKIHSVWSNKRICLFVDGDILMRLHEDWTATEVRSGVSNLSMSYVDINEKVYYSNASVNGWVDTLGEDNRFSDPTENHKVSVPTGQHIEFYNGRMYIARNETLWFTDGYNLNAVDMRSNAIGFKDEITMLKAVDDGLWISIGDVAGRGEIKFLSGGTPEDFVQMNKANYGAIEGTAVKPKSAFVGEGLPGKSVIWASRKGICLGENGGKFTNMTATRYSVPDNRYGAGLFRIIDGLPQYIASTWT